MKKLIAAVFCVSVICFVACKTSNSTTASAPEPGVFNPENITFTFLDDSHAEVVYDYRKAAQNKDHFVCSLVKSECELKVKDRKEESSVQKMKEVKDKNGFIKGGVDIGVGATCYHIVAIKKDGNLSTLTKAIPGRTCRE